MTKNLTFTKTHTDAFVTEVLQGTDVAYSAKIGQFAGSPAHRRYYWISKVYGRLQSEGYTRTLAEAKAAVQADWDCIAAAFEVA